MLCPELCSLGFVSVARPYDVLACLQLFSAFAVDALLRKELFPEFSRVRVSGATLNQAAKDLALVSELCEVFVEKVLCRSNFGFSVAVLKTE